MANVEPVEPHVVALDAQALREGAWPKPNARLRRLAELVHHFGSNLWLMEGALCEVRGDTERKAIGAAESLVKARDAVRQKGLQAEASSTGLGDMLTAWDRQSGEALGELRATTIPFTSRPVEELFAMGVGRVSPFTEKGRGFRDAVIFLSLVDEMDRLGLSVAILVSRDGDFRDCKSPISGQQIHVMDLDEAIENCEALFKLKKAALFKELAAEAAVRRALAAEAVRQAAAQIEVFVRENLDVGASDIPDLGGVLEKPLSYGFSDVISLSLSPYLEDVEPGTVIDIWGVLELIGEFEIIPSRASERRFKLGEDWQTAIQHEALSPILEGRMRRETATVTLPFEAWADLRLTRTPEGYRGLEISRISSDLSPTQRGLVAAMRARKASVSDD